MSIDVKTITDLYDAMLPETGAPASGRIHPFVGGTFTGAVDGLRVMAVGINCYAGDAAMTSPAWFPAM